MATKNVNKTRLLMKHDIEANWLKAENFIPLEGEIVVYDADETHSRPRMKIGDGGTKVNTLPFAISDVEATEDEVLQAMASLNSFPAVTDAEGVILTDENGNVLLM